MDLIAWMHGRYTFEAITDAISNMGRKRGQPPITFRDKPYGMEHKDTKPVELSEAEKKQYADALFHRLEVMQYNFNANGPGRENTKKRSGKNAKTGSDEGVAE